MLFGFVLFAKIWAGIGSKDEALRMEWGANKFFSGSLPYSLFNFNYTLPEQGTATANYLLLLGCY